jgi:hypothetical protein
VYVVSCLSTNMESMRKFDVVSDVIKVYRTSHKQFLCTNKIMRSLKIDSGSRSLCRSKVGFEFCSEPEFLL